MTEDVPRKRARAKGKQPADPTARLAAKHTAPKPSMSFEEALSVLRAGHKEALALEPSSRGALLDRLGADARVREAALAFLAYALTPLGDQLERPDDAPAIHDLAFALIRFLDAAEKARFVNGVLFNVADPSIYHFLRDAVCESFSSVELEKAILERARSKNELHARNALELSYYVFSHPDFQLSEEGRNEIYAIRSARGDRA